MNFDLHLLIGFSRVHLKEFVLDDLGPLTGQSLREGIRWTASQPKKSSKVPNGSKGVGDIVKVLSEPFSSK